MDAPPLGGFIEVNGHPLWFLHSGDGGPATVFVPGAGSFGLDFLLAHQFVSKKTTSLLYDRAGTGWSEDVKLPRSIDEVTDELRDLLEALALPGPYVLVGHSLGGAYVQRYAQRFSKNVAGLLLLDPLHEDWDEYMPQHLKLTATARDDATMPELPAQILDQLRAMLLDTLADVPEPIRDAIVAKHVSPERLETGFREGLNVLAVLEDLRRGGPRPNVPIAILSADGIDAQQLMFATEDQLRDQIRASERLYDALAAAAPQGKHQTLADASHATMPMTRPDAVADAVTDLLDRINAAAPVDLVD
jgi:pimeloyl-ACP methyl ester carboxylesterase